MRLFLGIFAYLFDTVAVAVVDDDFVTLLQLVPCSVPVEVERMVVWSFVH